MKTYRVSFDTKKNNVMTHYLIHLESNSKKEAEAKAKELWTRNHIEHMFHIFVKEYTFWDNPVLGAFTPTSREMYR